MNRRRKKALAQERRVAERQRNVLFEDAVRNAKGIDDVLWNGPSSLTA